MDTNIVQLPLWSDEELPERQEFSFDEEQDTLKEGTSNGKLPLATQLYLPGCEPE